MSSKKKLKQDAESGSDAPTCSVSSITPGMPWHAEYLKAADRAMLMECQRNEAKKRVEELEEALHEIYQSTSCTTTQYELIEKVLRPGAGWVRLDEACPHCENPWLWHLPEYLTGEELQCPACKAHKTDSGTWIMPETGLSSQNDDVDATGPGTSRGTDADGAPRTCVDSPALPGCIPRLVRSWRVGSTAPSRTTQPWHNRHDPASEKSGTPGKSSPRSRRADGCCQWQVGKAHAQLTATGHAAVISRIMAPHQQDQIGRSRGRPSRRPGASRRLSGKERHRPETGRSPARHIWQRNVWAKE